MEILKFNTQICTTVEQSKRLLELGLKPETAECYNREEEWGYSCWIGKSSLPTDIPAWSLHRLMEMLPFTISLAKGDIRYITILKGSVHYVTFDDDVSREITFNQLGANIYDNIIDCIEWLIKESYFNKDYLK